MVRGYVPLLLIVAGIWGASYLFIKVAVREIEPTAMMDLRLIFAAGVLVPVLAWRLGSRGALAEVRSTGAAAFVLGVTNMAVPFVLIAWGEKHIDSGVAAIANASVPIFVALLAIRFNPSERVTGMRLAGVVASLSYASANLYTQHRFPRTSPLVITTASVLAASLVLLPFALLQFPDAMPSWKALASVAALGIAGTAIALLFFYAMLNRYGASRASLVTYLLPPFALVYGVVFLNENMTLNAVLGLLLILAGVALGSGFLQLARRRAPAPATPRP